LRGHAAQRRLRIDFNNACVFARDEAGFL
jgi:hypothetical protein